MSGIMQFEFRLFGPRKGQTTVINGHQFVNGVYALVQSSDNMGTAARVFSFYGAYARGTPEYDAAVAKEEAEANGASKVSEASLEGIDPPAPAGVQSDGGGSPEEAAVSSGSDADANRPDTASAGADRDGHGHAGIPVFPEDANYRAEEPSSSVNLDIAAAVRKLDPDVDSHWVMTGAHKGKPKLNAVEEAYGKANLTRQDVEAAAPGYDRGTASELALVA